MTRIAAVGSREPITTRQLLAAIDAHRMGWPEQFPDHSVPALTTALAREMAAGTIDATGGLTREGRAALSGPDDTGAPDAGYEVGTWQSLESQQSRSA